MCIRDRCKKAIRKAFENSMAGNGFSLVEVVSTCNSGWKLSPVASNQWLAENMLPFYPLGDIKDVKKEERYERDIDNCRIRRTGRPLDG